MSWESTLENATKLVEAQKKLVTASTPAEADEIIASAANAMTEESPRIAALLRAQGHGGLVNRLTAAFDVFAKYAVKPARNEARLIGLIDSHLRLLLLDLRETVAQTGIEALPPSSTIAALVLLTVTEARKRFGYQEAIKEVVADANTDAEQIRQAIRTQSDARFRIETRDTHEGLIELGFAFDSTFRLVKITARITDANLEEVRVAMKIAQQREFERLPRVQQLTAFQTALGGVAAFTEETEAAQLLTPPVVAPQVLAPPMPIRAPSTET